MKSFQKISNFIFKQNLRYTIIWAVILEVYAFSKVYGYVKAYPNSLQRAQIAKTIGSSASSLSILTGPANNIQTISGYFIWSCFMILLFGAIFYAVFSVIKHLSDNEYSSRFDLILGGEADLFKLTKAVLGGLLKSFAVFFLILFVGLSLLGKNSLVNISPINMFSVSFIVLLAGLLFASLTLFISQLLEGKKSVTIVMVILFGLSYILKAIGDTTSAKWLINISPLGWFEKLNPILGLNPVWFIPIFLFILVFTSLGLFLSSRREVQTPIIKPKENYKSRLWSLRNFYVGFFRFKIFLLLRWSIVVLILTFIYASLSKTILNLINDSHKLHRSIAKLINNPSSNDLKLYISLVYFISVFYISFFVANSINRFMHDEIDGTDQNYLNAKISRIKLILTKIAYQGLGLIFLSLIVDFGILIGIKVIGLDGLSLANIFIFGLNILFPLIFILATGIFLIGLFPKISGFLSYGFCVISALGGILASGLKLNHYLVDLFIFNHLDLKNLNVFNYKTNLIISLISLGLIIFGVIRYRSRDLIFE